MPEVKDAQKETAKEPNWQELLLDSEKGKDGDTEFVYIKGLRRLAKIKGISKECHPFINVTVLKRTDNGKDYPFVQAAYQVEFKDGTVWSDVADAHSYNTEGIFAAYPTAMAAVRAEARALRKALGISLVAKEELGANPDKVASFKNEITSAQIRVIKNLMKARSITSQADVIKEASQRDDVFDVEELTFEEAKSAIKWLNSQKVK